jgi:hypothetical protein
MRITAKLGLAHKIVKAAKTREDSWVKVEGSYAKSILFCCHEVATDKDEAELVFLLLYSAWNDALFWAENLISKFNK